METKTYDVKRRTYNYALGVIKFLEGLPEDSNTRTIGNQLLRSATSVGANVVEAQSASSRKDFANFYSHSLKSANESKFWLGLLKDAGKAPRHLVDPLLDETHELANILASSLLTLKGRK